MASRTPPLSLLIVAALSLSSLCLQQLPIAVAEASSGFDLFVLSLYWPDAVCLKSTQPYCCFDNQCCRFNRPSGFVINGLWPDYADGTWPSCCNGLPFNEDKISGLIPYLVEYWPNLYCSPGSSCNGEKGNSWSQEWAKHGTCAIPVIKDQRSYFLKALNLYYDYNLTKALDDAGVKPSNAVLYPLEKIQSIIEKVTGATPLLLCQKKSLYQVRLCFTKNFKPRNCVATKGNSCPKSVILPTLKPEPRDGNAAIPWEANVEGFEPLIEI